uniref:RNA-directed DNA polymerase n=1 Tax=Strongyloides papillosus TaxID=174720 RepID=A0A0N5C5K1_STREA
MGLSGSPGTFQRIMDHIFSDMRSSILVYIDDIIVFSNTEEEHLHILEEFFHRIIDSGLKLRMDKSRFGVRQLKYLGFVVSIDGISPDPEKTKAISNMTAPDNIRKLREFLGMLNFFGRFIKDFATISEPLRFLLRKDVPFIWTDTCTAAFETLKKCLMTTPILSASKAEGEFLLFTDASYAGLGAVLFQRQPELKVITYISRSINKFESNYPPIHLEALAIVWALSQLDPYIIGMPITIYTDHQPLLSLFGSRQLQGKLARYQLRLMQYKATIRYQPGGENVVADYLSRHPSEWRYTNDKETKYEQWVKEEKAIFSKGRYYKMSGNMVLGIIPTVSVQKNYIEEFHKHPLFGGHMGWEKVKEKLIQAIFWDTIEEDYKELAKSCLICQKNKTIPGYLIKSKPQIPEVGAIPLGKVHIDLLQPGRKTSSGNIAMMVAVDSLTRFVIVGPVKLLSSEEIIETIMENIIFKFGCPKKIVTDRGTCFTSLEFENFTKALGISHHLTTPNHHQSNGLVERMNRNFNEAIRMYQDDEWDETVKVTACCYNNLVHPKTKMTPSYLMFGRLTNPNISQENILVKSKYKEDIRKWEENISKLQETWMNHHRKSWEKAKGTENFEINLQPKQLVLRKRMVDKRGKLSPWEGPYEVLQVDEHQRALIKKGRKKEWIHVSQLKKFIPEGLEKGGKEGCKDI